LALNLARDSDGKRARKLMEHLPTSGAAAFAFEKDGADKNGAHFLGFWRP
jgi:hypothetical protein